MALLKKYLHLRRGTSAAASTLEQSSSAASPDNTGLQVLGCNLGVTEEIGDRPSPTRKPLSLVEHELETAMTDLQKLFQLLASYIGHHCFVPENIVKDAMKKAESGDYTKAAPKFAEIISDFRQNQERAKKSSHVKMTVVMHYLSKLYPVAVILFGLTCIAAEVISFTT